MTDTASTAPPETPERWARVEIFGHRHHYGRVREVEMVGTKMLMIEVPVDGDPDANGWETLVYGGASIFSIAFVDKEKALAANRPYRPRLIAAASSDVDETLLTDDGIDDDAADPEDE